MTLAFSTKWPKHMPANMAGQPTRFMEKITENLLRDQLIKIPKQDWGLYWKYHEFPNYVVGSEKQKRHSIRRDEHNRWKPGMDIHFVINNRTPWRFQFAPIVKCTGTQKVVICYKDQDGLTMAEPRVYIDNVWLANVEQLAINDGFNSVEDFFAWFNTDFTGKIIHWTDLKY